MNAAGSRDWPGVDLCLETGDLLEPGALQAHPVDPPGRLRQPRAVYKYWAGLRLARTSL